MIGEEATKAAAFVEGHVNDFERHILGAIVTHEGGGLKIAQADLKSKLDRGARREVPTDRGNTAAEAGSFDLKAARFFEVGADGDDGLVEAHTFVTALTHKLAVGREGERRKSEISLLESTVRQEGSGPCKIEFFERLHRGDAQLLRLKPPEEFLGLENALERGDGFGCGNAAESFDGFHAKIGSGTCGQIAVDDCEQAAQGFAIFSDTDFVNRERHHQWVEMIKQFEQNAAAPR